MPFKSAAAVFVDRDGTLIRDVGYLSRMDQLEVLPGVPEGIRRLRSVGLKVVMVTNQSGVARGMLSEAELNAIHHQLRQDLSREGALFDGIYYCPHHPEVGSNGYRLICGCRKPKPGMVEKAAADLGIDPGRSYVVGDQATDIELAARIRARGVWIRNRLSIPEPTQFDYTTVMDFSEAAEWITKHFSSHSAEH